MSYQYKGVTIDKFDLIWPIIASNLSFGHDDSSKVSNGQKTGADLLDLQEIVRTCSNHEPVNFSEYISYVLVSTISELLKSPTKPFRLQSAQLMAHTFNPNIEQWYRDHQKVKKHKTFSQCIKFLKQIEAFKNVVHISLLLFFNFTKNLLIYFFVYLK